MICRHKKKGLCPVSKHISIKWKMASPTLFGPEVHQGRLKVKGCKFPSIGNMNLKICPGLFSRNFTILLTKACTFASSFMKCVSSSHRPMSQNNSIHESRTNNFDCIGKTIFFTTLVLYSPKTRKYIFRKKKN